LPEREGKGERDRGARRSHASRLQGEGAFRSARPERQIQLVAPGHCRWKAVSARPGRSPLLRHQVEMTEGRPVPAQRPASLAGPREPSRLNWEDFTEKGDLQG